MQPGDLVQVKKGVNGQGEIGILIGPAEDNPWHRDLLKVLFHDGIHDVHPSNLQKPDGRTRRKR